MKNKYTFAFTLGPERQNEFYNAWSSMLDIKHYPENVILVFNPFCYKDHDVFFDMAEIRNNTIILKYQEQKSLAYVWNRQIIEAPTDIVAVLNDDIVFSDENLLEKIDQKFEEGYDIVHATENWSGFFIHKRAIAKIGFFDENYSHSWEDVDYRYRIARHNYHKDPASNLPDFKEYRFDPHLIRHMRSTNGRFQNTWDKSSEYFFKKWNIEKFLNLNKILNAQERRDLQSTGFFRNKTGIEFTPSKSERPSNYNEIERSYVQRYLSI